MNPTETTWLSAETSHEDLTTAASYPRPQLRRPDWADLCGPWHFCFDDADRITVRQAAQAQGFRQIIVPFPPESAASGIGDQGFHRVMWYSRSFGSADLARAGLTGDKRLILHCGAIDYRCQIWIDGHFVGAHVGGHSPFSLDVTDALSGDTIHSLVIRVEDDPTDVTQPRGKQDWHEQPHSIWYPRTSGVWQPIWFEAVPALRIEGIGWATDLEHGLVTAHLRLSARPQSPVVVDIALLDPRGGQASRRVGYQADGGGSITAQIVVGDQASSGMGKDSSLAHVTATATEQELVIPIHLDRLTNGQELDSILWTPDNPRLIGAQISVGEDSVSSYLGLRTVGVDDGRFLLNRHPCFVRAVLDQGYWPETHLAAPDVEALRADVELLKSLGFNTVRLHQKYEDPRFLFLADRLGLMVWGESPAAYAFTPDTIRRNSDEWLSIVQRDQAHPALVAWVPFNESWGIQQVGDDRAMQEYQRGVVALTRALDPTRPVVSNDGWEMIDSDIIAIHDYSGDPASIEHRYADQADVATLVRGRGPSGRRLIIGEPRRGAAVMVTEFGGITYSDDAAHTWGYTSTQSSDDFARRLHALFDAIHASPVLAGFCYTQFADTWQEANGLVHSDRTPKLAIDQIREIIVGG
ncbi:MAG: glycoside hydrolase family 2 [Propionibacteriaceae bacterium]|jgi:beta-galactosidase/beta-glucuronidase|nr:glycoside hydrolase family 2 [Propionibacteriaceae bacterium]